MIEFVKKVVQGEPAREYIEVDCDCSCDANDDDDGWFLGGLLLVGILIAFWYITIPVAIAIWWFHDEES